METACQIILIHFTFLLLPKMSLSISRKAFKSSGLFLPPSTLDVFANHVQYYFMECLAQIKFHKSKYSTSLSQGDVSQDGLYKSQSGCL